MHFSGGEQPIQGDDRVEHGNQNGYRKQFLERLPKTATAATRATSAPPRQGPSSLKSSWAWVHPGQVPELGHGV